MFIIEQKKPIRDQYLIIKNGKLAGMGAHSYRNKINSATKKF